MSCLPLPLSIELLGVDMPDVQNYFIGYVQYPHKDWKHGGIQANVSSVFFRDNSVFVIAKGK